MSDYYLVDVSNLHQKEVKKRLKVFITFTNVIFLFWG